MTDPTPSSTSSRATGDSPSPSRLWPTPQAHDAQGPKTPEQIATMRAKGHGVKNLNEEVRSAPSASRRSSPMPVPCSPTDSLVCPTSVPFSRSPEIAYFVSAVRSRLSLLVDFLASPTAPPASDSPEPTTGTSGPNASECFGSFDPALPSSRMFPGSSVPSPLPRMVTHAKDFFSTGFCQTWPKSGLLVRGKLYPQPRLALPTNGTASGSSALTSEAWPTASARDWKDTPGMALDGVNPDGSHRDRTDLLPRKVYEMERAGPPPTASGPPDPVKRSTSGSPAGQWLTPRANEPGTDPNFVNRMGDRGAHCFVALNAQVESKSAGKLNPSWVETLMGLPLGWTQLPRKFVKPRATK